MLDQVDISQIVYVWLTELTVTTTWLPLSDFSLKLSMVTEYLISSGIIYYPFKEKISQNLAILASTDILIKSVCDLKVACRVQIWKKKFFCQNSDKFGYSFIKNDIMFMYILCTNKRNIILNLFKIDTLNLTMYILTILTSPLKTYVIGLHNLISMNIFFNIKFLLYNCKKTA